MAEDELRDLDVDACIVQARGAGVAAIVREGRIIIPGGMTTIEPGDHVLVVTNVTGLTDLKHILA